MLLLAALLQTLEADEMATPRRLFAKRECRAEARNEILVCGGKPGPDRLAKLQPKPDPMLVDKRPRLKITDHFALRLGFTITPEFN
ncbi:MAG: hypothetical protein ABW023_11430 [Sphingomonas sp.]